MKVKRCPYCGRRVSYSSAYSCRRKGEYFCERCGKESRVVVNKTIYLLFAVFALVALGIMAGWLYSGLASNIFGVVLVAVPLIIFMMITPKFLYFEPLKKYKKSMEAKKAGIEYSDNLINSDMNKFDSSYFKSAPSEDSQFKMNNDVFNRIKEERNEARKKLQNNESISDSARIENTSKSYVPIINDVSDDHASADAPLKKIHSEAVYGRQHYIPVDSDSHVKKNKKTDGNKYSSNRRC